MFKFKLIVFCIFVSFSFSNSVGLAKETKKRLSIKEKKALKEEKKILKSQKAMWIAHVLRDKKPDNTINQLELVQEKIPVFLVPRGNEFRPLVKLSFRHPSSKEGLKLLDANRIPLRFDAQTKTYSLYVYLTSQVNTVKLTAELPGVGRKSETLYLFAPEAREFRAVKVFDSVQFFIGHTSLEFEQTSAAFAEYKTQSLLLGIKYVSPENGRKIGYYGDVFSTVFAYSAEPIDESAQFLEARLGLTYSTKLFKNPRSRSRFSVGVRTINLFSLADLGFSGLMGLNMGLRSELFSSGTNSFAYEVEYAPYDFSDPFRERTLKASLEWNRNLKNIRRMQLGLSYSDSAFTTGLEQINLRAMSLYLGLSF